MAIHLDPRDAQVRSRPAPRATARAEALPHRRRFTPRHAPLPGISTPNVALAALQLLVGYEWLVSGVDKLLLGTFPALLPQLLSGSIGGGRLPGFFAALLQHLVLPNAQFFGVLIEWSETLAGVGLMAAGLVTLLRPLAERHLTLRTALLFSYGAYLLDLLAPAAAIGAGLLGLSFFLLDGLPIPWFTPSVAYGGALDTGLFLAIASAVLVAGQFARTHRS